MPLLKGKTLSLVADGLNVPSGDLVRIDERELGKTQLPITLVLRIEDNPTAVLRSAAFLGLGLRAQVLVQVTITTGVGVTLQRNVILSGRNVRTLRLPIAQTVTVQALLVDSSSNLGQPYPAGFPFPPAAGLSATVTALVTDQQVDFLGQDFPQWNPSGAPFAGVPGYSPVGGPGALLAAQGCITNMGGAAALWLWLFDSQDLFIKSYTVTAGGSGYVSPPTVSIAAGAAGDIGPGFAIPAVTPVATLTGGVVTSLAYPAGTLPNWRGTMGLGWLTAPVITFSSGAATATGTLSQVPSAYILPVIGPFFSTGPFSFEDELKDAAFFEAGLSWALSSSPTAFTLVSGAVARVDLKVAQ